MQVNSLSFSRREEQRQTVLVKSACAETRPPGLASQLYLFLSSFVALGTSLNLSASVSFAK